MVKVRVEFSACYAKDLFEETPPNFYSYQGKIKFPGIKRYHRDIGGRDSDSKEQRELGVALESLAEGITWTVLDYRLKRVNYEIIASKGENPESRCPPSSNCKGHIHTRKPSEKAVKRLLEILHDPMFIAESCFERIFPMEVKIGLYLPNRGILVPYVRIEK